MKYIKKITLFLIMFLTFINCGYARDCAEPIVGKVGFNEPTGLLYSYSYNTNQQNIDYKYKLYNFNTSKGESIYGYCFEAGKKSKKNSNADASFNCQRPIFDVADGKSNEQHILDAGIIAIFQNGYSNKNKNGPLTYNGKTFTDGESFAVTELALRIYGMYFGSVGYGGYSTTQLNPSHQAYADAWYSTLNKNGLVSRATGKSYTPFNPKGKSLGWKFNGADVSSDIEGAARDLVAKGLEAAAAFRENPKVASIKVTRMPDASNSRKAELDSETDIINYEYTVEYTINISNFNSSDAYVKFEFSCPECARNGVNYEIFLNDKSYGTTFPSDMLKDSSLVTNGSGDINLKITFKASSDTYDCKNLKYDISYKYKDDTISTEVYEYQADGCTNCQKFFVLYTDDAEFNDHVGDGKGGDGGEDLNLCISVTLDDTCAGLQRQCNLNIEGACEKFNEEYGGECVNCTPYVGETMCTTETSEFDVLEGYENKDFSCTTPPDKENIKKCIINGKDINNESYQDTKQISNEFCSVWCKEDYHFTMPGDVSVTSVRYLELRAGIKGTKKCYASLNKGDVDTPGSFEYMYEQVRKKMIDAYNNYIFYQSAYDARNDVTTTEIPSKQVESHCNYVTYPGVTGTIKYVNTYGNLSLTPYDSYVSPVTVATKFDYLPEKGISYGAMALVREYDEDNRSYYVNAYQNQGSVTSSKWVLKKTRVNISSADGFYVQYLNDIKLNYTTIYYWYRNTWVTVDYLPKPQTVCEPHAEGTYESYKNYSLTWSFDLYDSSSTDVNGKKTNSWDAINKLPKEDNVTCVPRSGKVYCTYESKGHYGEYTHSTPTDIVTRSEDGAKFDYDYYKRMADNAETQIQNFSTELDRLVQKYNDCTTWQMDYHYDPVVKFDYEEEYMQHILSNEMEPIDEIEKGELKVYKCTSEVDDSYTECKDGWVISSTPVNDTGTMGEDKFIIKIESGKAVPKKETIKLSKTLAMKEEITVNAEYWVPSQYSNINPSGGIVETTETDIPNGSLLEHALPVGAQAQGYYNYAIIVGDLGEYYGTDNLGRIWGDEVNLFRTTVQVVHEANSACYAVGGVKTNYDGIVKDYENGVYACRYSVNIPECDPDPDGKCDPNCPNDPDCPDNPVDPGGCDPEPDGKCDPNCPDDPDCPKQCPDCPVVCDPDFGCYYEGPNCPPKSCPVVCTNCVYNNGLNVQNRPVTPDDFNPNDRDLGDNWDSGMDFDNPDKSVNIKTSLQLKAYATTKEIINDGKIIYDVEENSSGLTSASGDLSVLVDMDSRMIRWIQEYNKSKENEGGFASDTLECYDYELNGKTYANVFCYSSFMDDLIDRFGNTKVKFSVERPAKGSRSGHPSGTNYFTTWEKSERSNWHVTNTTTELNVFTQNFGYDRENERDYGIGPSWK